MGGGKQVRRAQQRQPYSKLRNGAAHTHIPSLQAERAMGPETRNPQGLPRITLFKTGKTTTRSASPLLAASPWCLSCDRRGTWGPKERSHHGQAAPRTWHQPAYNPRPHAESVPGCLAIGRYSETERDLALRGCLLWHPGKCGRRGAARFARVRRFGRRKTPAGGGW